MKAVRMFLLTLVFSLTITAAWADCVSPKTVKEVRDCWVTNWNDKNLNRVVSLYAEDATFENSDGTFIGREQIRAALQKLMESGNVQLTVSSLKGDTSGELSYDSGSFDETITTGGVMIKGGVVIKGGVKVSGGDSKKEHGSYLVVLKKEKGKLLIVQHASVTQQPPHE